MSERGEALSSERERERERENSCGDHIFCLLVFIVAIGAHSIYEEVAGFYPLWFLRGKFFVSLFSCFIALHVILSVKDPKIIMLA